VDYGRRKGNEDFSALVFEAEGYPMSAGTDPTASNLGGNPASFDPRGHQLRPSTVGVLKRALNLYRQWEPDFVAAYFPRVAERGDARMEDIFELDDQQADALRPIMAESIQYFWKQDGRDKNRNLNLLTHQPEDPSFVSFHARKAKYWTEAIRDLCRVFGLESPV
jgi:hypothetical protein